MTDEQPGPSGQLMECTSRDNTAEQPGKSRAMDFEDSVVCKNSVPSGSGVYLHPLVTMNIADHTTRCKISDKEFKYGQFIYHVYYLFLFVFIMCSGPHYISNTY